MKRSPACLLLLILAACGRETPPPAGTLELPEVLGGSDTAGFLRADAPRAFSFPADHGPHAGFRNEWWYLTGNLAAADGRRFGYQVTFFSTALPPATPAGAASAWRSGQVWMAHFALTDVEAGAHEAFERFSRENPGLAGATAAPLRVWLDDWQLTGEAGAWQLAVREGDAALSLDLEPLKPPVLQGDAGLSQKSPEPGNASYYYSLTRLGTRGTLTSGGETFAVEGLSWLDREWSTSALAPDQSGWDWFSLQFDDGQELMYYQLRDLEGAAHPQSRGNWTDREARQTAIMPGEVELEELDTWTSPAGVDYAVAWQLRYGGRSWEIRALVADQWMNLSLPYWEGAVEIRAEDGSLAGRGYLEMVRD